MASAILKHVIQAGQYTRAKYEATTGTHTFTGGETGTVVVFDDASETKFSFNKMIGLNVAPGLVAGTIASIIGADGGFGHWIRLAPAQTTGAFALYQTNASLTRFHVDPLGKVLANANAVALQPVSDGSTAMMQIGAPDGAFPAFLVDAFAGAPRLVLRRANGTAAARTKTLNGDTLGRLGGEGYKATGAYVGEPSASVSFVSTQDYDAAWGGEIVFRTIRSGEITTSIAGRIGSGVRIGTVAADPGTGKLEAELSVISPNFFTDKTNPVFTATAEAFENTGVGSTLYPWGSWLVTRWQTGAASKGATLSVQCIVEATAPAAGAAGAVQGGMLNKLNGTDAFGVIGMINNVSSVASPTGAAVWAITRGEAAATGTVDGFRATSEYSNSAKPRAALFAHNSSATNQWDTGAWIASAITDGVRVGFTGGSAAVLDPTWAFRATPKAGGTTFAVLMADGSTQIGGSAARSGTAGTKRLDLFEGTPVTGTLANGITLQCVGGHLVATRADGTTYDLTP